MTSSVYEEIDRDVQKVVAVYAARDWHDRKVLFGLRRELQAIGTRYSQKGQIRGYALEFNGVDASRHQPAWPLHIFDQAELTVRLLVMGIEETNTVQGASVAVLKRPGAEPAPAVRQATVAEEAEIMSALEATNANLGNSLEALGDSVEPDDEH